MNLQEVRWVSVPVIRDSRGSLAFLEEANNVPFCIVRIFFLFDIKAGEVRGGHAHKVTEQLIISVKGSFKVTLDDGNMSETFLCNDRSKGLYIPPMIWDKLYDFSSDAVCLVLASTCYDDNDYIRSQEEWHNLRGKNVIV